MEDFKSTAKMQCFKEGGSVKYKSRHSEKSEMSEDIAQDKKVVKKAFAMHDAQEHKGEKTDLSKLRKGGRAKKCGGGTVSRYKTGGSVTNVYEAKKSSGDKDNIRKTKDIKPGKAAAPSGAGGPDAYKKGGKIKKMAMGSMATAPSAPVGQGAISDLEKRRQMEKMARAKKYLGPAQQGELISQDPTAAGLTPPPMMRKKGGSIKKCAEGGALKDVDAEENPGLAKLPTNVRNKMGYMRKGGKAKKMMSGGTCS